MWIGGDRVGGYKRLRQHFGADVPAAEELTDRPIVVLFALAFALAIAVTLLVRRSAIESATIVWFVAIAMRLLALQKLQDVERFSTMFLNSDLLARRWVPYGYI